MSMGTGLIGPASWRNNATKEIKMSQNVVQRTDKSCDMGRSLDPLPNLRDVVAELSNDEAHRYFRQTRAVVCTLREALIDTNEEIKSMSRAKEALEKSLDHIRKDLFLNNDSKEKRVSRPSREKDKDGADDMLQAERMLLLNLKRQLESQLQLVQQQLLTLDKARKRLSDVTQERSRVLDLICHALPSGSATAFGGSMSNRYNTGRPKSRNAFSADMSRTDDVGIDPLGPYTPECDAALQEARDARSRGAMLRRDAADLINRCDKSQKQAHQSVNGGITGKIAETVGLKQRLQVASGENHHATNRAQRWYDATERAWGYSRGPVASSDLGIREKLHRPIINVFQRHPGTNLPEAQEIVKGGDGLLQSLHSTSRNIGLLKLAQLQLKDDIRDKKAAINVDGNIVRMRRRKANHRWVQGAAF